MYKCLPLEEMLHFRGSYCSTNSNIGQHIGSQFLVAERNSTSPPVCLFVCLSVCLSKFYPQFFYIIEEVIEVDELDEGNIYAAEGNKI